MVLQLDSQTSNSGRQISELNEKIRIAESSGTEAKKKAETIGIQIKNAEENLLNIQNKRESLRLERAEISEMVSSLKLHDIEISKDIEVQQIEIGRINSELSVRIQLQNQ